MYQWNLRRREKFKSLMISKWINWILVYSKSSLNKYIWIWKEPSVNWRFTADIWTDRRSVNFDKIDLFTQLTKQCRMTHPFANKECMYTRLISSDDDFYENYSKYSLFQYCVYWFLDSNVHTIPLLIYLILYTIEYTSIWWYSAVSFTVARVMHFVLALQFGHMGFSWFSLKLQLNSANQLGIVIILRSFELNMRCKCLNSFSY